MITVNILLFMLIYMQAINMIMLQVDILDEIHLAFRWFNLPTSTGDIFL